MRKLVRSGRNSERGVVAPIFAIFLIVMLGMAALVVDYGSLWQARRNLITATDAAALAAGKEFAIGGNGCVSVAGDYYTRNAPPGADAPVCTTPSAKTVKVDGSVDVPYIFGKIFGLTSESMTASTTVVIEQPYSVGGLRPLGLCYEMLDAQGALPPVVGTTVHVPWNNDGPDDCAAESQGNGIPGNWGYIDFDKVNGNPGNQIQDWTENGYPDEVSPGIFPPFTGSHTSLKKDLNDLIGICIGLPIYTVATGNGNNAEFTIVDFASVKLTEVKFTGSQASRYFKFTWDTCLVQGSGTGGGVDYGPKTIRICDVDSTTTNRCP